MKTITDSVHEVLSRDEVVADLFYDIFLDRHPDVREFFIGVDIRQQAIVLTMMLSLIEDYHLHSYGATANYLRLLGRRHRVRGIPRSLYPAFEDCLLETLQRFHGRDWNPTLAQQWRTGIRSAIEAMLEAYEPTYGTTDRRGSDAGD